MHKPRQLVQAGLKEHGMALGVHSPHTQPKHWAFHGKALIILISSTEITAPQCLIPLRISACTRFRRTNPGTHTVLYGSQALLLFSVRFTGGNFQSCLSFALYIFQYEAVQLVISLRLLQVSSPAESGKKTGFQNI